MPRSTAIRGWMFVSALGLLAALLSVSCWPMEAGAGSKYSASRPWAHKSRSLGAGNRSSADVWAPNAPVKPGPDTRGAEGTYNPEHIRRFWSHYHGGRKAKRSKPLERER